MAQNGFGRRQLTPRAVADRPATSGRSSSSAGSGEDPLATDASRSAWKSVAILAAVGSFVALTALGAAFALNVITRTDSGPAAGVAAPQECRGGMGNCTNQYNVALSCGSSEGPKSVSVLAADAEAAEHKAERYNGDCRSRGAVFVTSLVRTAANNSFRGPRAGESPTKVADRGSSTTSRRGWRFRRR